MARHSSLADQLATLRAYVQQPDHDPDPVQTNWSTIAANDNNPEDYADVHVERRISIRPTLQEIGANVRDGDIERGASTTMEVIFDQQRKDVVVPGPIVRIGKLKFSDGAQMERCYMAGIDGEPVIGHARMPLGSMLGSKEIQERTLGGAGVSAGESNAWFCEAFDVANREYVPGGRKRKGRSYSRDEAAAILAEAVANTPVMPAVYQCEDGIALGSARVADNFIGMKKSTKGNGGSIAWQHLSDKIAEREIFIEAERGLANGDRTVIATSQKARNMKDIGSSLGFTGKNAERRGKRAMIAANDNLMAAIRNYAA